MFILWLIVLVARRGVHVAIPRDGAMFLPTSRHDRKQHGRSLVKYSRRLLDVFQLFALTERIAGSRSWYATKVISHFGEAICFHPELTHRPIWRCDPGGRIDARRDRS